MLMGGCGAQETPARKEQKAAYATREAKLGARYDRQGEFFRLTPLDIKASVPLEAIRRVCPMFGMTYRQHTISGRQTVAYADVVCNIQTDKK
jgi:hypothetical protein